MLRLRGSYFTLKDNFIQYYSIFERLVHVLMSLPVWLLLIFLSEPILFEQGLGIDPELYLSMLAHLQVPGQLKPIAKG